MRAVYPTKSTRLFNISSFIHSFMYLLAYIHLQMHPKDVETVTI